MIKAIETVYKQHRFRSRLEARWAVFFDALGIEWEYEPEGYDLGEHGWYLPDFFLPKLEAVIEIKPSDAKIEYDSEIAAKTYQVARHKKWIGSVFVGMPGKEKIHVLCWDLKYEGSGGEYYWGQNYEWFRWYIGPDGYPRFWYDEEDDRLVYRDSSFEYRLSPIAWASANADDSRILSPAIVEAYRAASSARFEHGEKPL